MHQSIRNIAMEANKLQADDSGVCGQVVWLHACCLIRLLLQGLIVCYLLYFFFCILAASSQIFQDIKHSSLFDF